MHKLGSSHTLTCSVIALAYVDTCLGSEWNHHNIVTEPHLHSQSDPHELMVISHVCMQISHVFVCLHIPMRFHCKLE